MNKIYLDYSATTKVSEAVFEKMKPYFTDIFGNADSLHSFGAESALAVDDARRNIARILGVDSKEIYFTSSGTESNNFALYGICNANIQKGKHIIISSVEHASIFDTATRLTKDGFRVDFVKVDSDGIIDIEHLKSLICDDTILISVIMANNEIGTIMPLEKISILAKEKGIYFHTDAVSAVGQIVVDIKKVGCDLLSFSPHKFYGCKGVGMLYIKKGTKISPIISGGHQERSLRGGTTFVAGVVGGSYALQYAIENLEKNADYISSLRDYFVERITKEVDNTFVLGGKQKTPCSANILFRGINGAKLIHSLDLNNIACSAGSACSSGSATPSRILLAIGLSKKDALSCVRFSLGKETTKEEINHVVDTIKKIIAHK